MPLYRRSGSSHPPGRAESRTGALVLLSVLTVCSCSRFDSRPARAAERERLTVVVSIVPQAWLVRQIAGDVEVVTLVGPGESPHTFQPSDAQVSRLLRADLFFCIGVSFERGPWFDAVAAPGQLAIVDMRRAIKLRRMPGHAHGDEGAGPDDVATGQHHFEPDPHIWLSPRLLKTQARTVADALIEVDPSNKTRYEAGLEEVQRRLDEVSRTIRDKLARHSGKAFLVFHPAWGYFAQEFGLRQIAVEPEGKAPADFELTRLQRQARAEGIRILFAQPQIAGRGARAVAAAIGGRVQPLDPLAPDIPENLLHFAEMLAASFE